jgi:hypothetical protein
MYVTYTAKIDALFTCVLISLIWFDHIVVRFNNNFFKLSWLSPQSNTFSIHGFYTQSRWTKFRICSVQWSLCFRATVVDDGSVATCRVTDSRIMREIIKEEPPMTFNGSVGWAFRDKPNENRRKCEREDAGFLILVLCASRIHKYPHSPCTYTPLTEDGVYHKINKK